MDSELQEDYPMLQLHHAHSDILNRVPTEPFLRKGNSLEDVQEMRQNTRNFILTNVIHMNLNPRQAEQLLESMDLQEDKNVLLNRIVNQLLAQDNEGEEQKQQSGMKELMLRSVARLSQILPKRERISLARNYTAKHQQKKVECLICFDCVPEQQTIAISPCQQRFCRNCLTEYLNNKILVADILDLGCPSDGCRSLLNEEFIQKLVTPEKFEKYKKFLKIKILSSDTLIRWCPKGCETYVKGQEGASKVDCPKCQVEICFKCGNVYHGLRSCAAELDSAYRTAMKKYLIYNCPGCKTPIQKNDGCNHMTCYKCRYQFCWLCRSKYKGDHYSVDYLNYIWGCPGKQYSKEHPYRYPLLWKFVRTLLALALLPFVLAIGLALGILAAALVIIGVGFTGPAALYMASVPRNKFIQYTKSYQYFVFAMWAVLGIVCYPITYVIYIFGAIGAALFFLAKGIYFVAKRAYVIFGRRNKRYIFI